MATMDKTVTIGSQRSVPDNFVFEANLADAATPSSKKASCIRFHEFADAENIDSEKSTDTEDMERWSGHFGSVELGDDHHNHNLGNLIDNDMAQVVGSKASIETKGDAMGRIHSGSSTKSQEMARFYRNTSRLEGSTIRESGVLHSVRGTSTRRSEKSTNIMDSFVTELFLPSDGMYLNQHHLAMRQRIVKHIFALDDVSQSIKKAINVEASSKRTQRLRPSRLLPEGWTDCRRMLRETIANCSNLRQFAKDTVGHSGFITFFLVLSIYAVFTPDLVALACPKEWDVPFSIVNLVVFFFLTVELIFIIMADKRYLITVPFVLDVLVLISFLRETYFFVEMEDDNSQYSRAARSSRMTRLARIARVARITRLIPRVMQLFRKNKELLAKQLLTRRIRRAFMFLDADNDGLLSFFDFKCFYFCILKGCPELLNKKMMELINLDRNVLCADELVNSEHWNHYTFDDFSRLFFETAMGRSVIQYHVEDIQHKRGVWRLTQMLTDSTTLKVCIGILILVVTFNTLEVDVDDIYPEQGLGHLSTTVYREKQSLLTGGSPHLDHICDQISIYADHVDLLFLNLDGARFEPGSACLNLSKRETIEEAFAAINHIYATTSLRKSELLISCWPHGVACDTNRTVSVVLIDQRSKIQHELLWASVTTLTILCILLLFIFLFNRGITKFSTTTMLPLHALADDMMAMSCLDLVHIDADDPAKGQMSSALSVAKKESANAEELQHLQTAFKSMRSAIRSWSMYVPPALVQRLFSAGIEATIGVTRQKATVLFCDVDGFEDACRGLAPDKVIAVLSMVLADIAELIHLRRGTLLEFIGDEVLAVFNTPTALRSHVYAAVACALEIHQQVKRLLPIETRDNGLVPIRCRCGVHTAQVLAGNIGSHKRMKFGVLGDAINLTARLKGLNSRYQTETLTTDSVIEDDNVLRKCVFRPLDVVAVKGRRGSTTLFEVFGFAKSPEMNTAKLAAELHEHAMELYQKREFEEAKKCFEQVANMEVTGHRDQPSWLLIERCSKYLKHPPPVNWDYVERLTKKEFEPTQVREDKEQMTSLEVAPDFHLSPPECVHSKHVLRTRGLHGPAGPVPLLRAAGRTPNTPNGRADVDVPP